MQLWEESKYPVTQEVQYVKFKQLAHFEGHFSQDIKT